MVKKVMKNVQMNDFIFSILPLFNFSSYICKELVQYNI